MAEGQGITLESVVERLAKAERQLRRAKIAAVIVLVLVGAELVMGQASPRGKTVEGERFVVRDAEGRTRIELGFRRQNCPSLRVFHGDGTLRAQLGLAENGRPHLVLCDNEGNARIALKLLRPDGRPGLFLSDELGDHRAGLTLLPGDRPFLALTTEGQDQRTWMGPGRLEMFAEGRPRASMGAPESGTPAFCLRDEEGTFRVVLRLDAETDSPELKLTGKNGEVLFEVP